MKSFKRVLSLFLVLAALFSSQLTNSVSAATSTKKYDCDKTVTMKVTTGNAAASMKLVCKAATKSQTVNRVFFGSKTYKHTCSSAPKMTIKVWPKVDGKQYFYLQGWGKSISSTLKLNKNTTYTVEISYYRNTCNLCKCSTNDLTIFHAGEAVANPRYYCNGTWYVSSIKNLSIQKIAVR